MILQIALATSLFYGVPSQLTPQDREQLPPECQLYPNSPCLIPMEPGIKETEQQREQREYQERQLRLQCSNHPKTPGC